MRLAALFIVAVACSAQPLVTVSGTVVEATGSNSVGSATVSWPTFMYNGQPIISGSRDIRPASGVLSTTLYPGNYTVVYRFQNGSTTTMRWVVPVGAPWTRTISEVQTTFVSTPTNYPIPVALGGTGEDTFTAGRCIQMNSAGTAFESAAAACASAAGVTSVGLVLPAIFTVSGSPITSSGNITATLATQSPGLVFAGPVSGAAASPTFRPLNGLDLPSPTVSEKGGAISTACSGSNRISSFNTDGTFTCSATGDTAGAVSSTNGNLAAFSGTTGKVLADSGKAAPAGAIVGTTDPQTLDNKTLNQPTILDFSNAVHGHINLATGGTLAATAIGAGIIDPARLGSGTANSTTCLHGDSTWVACGSGTGSSVGVTFGIGSAGGTLTHNFGSSTHVEKCYSATGEYIGYADPRGTNVDTYVFSPVLATTVTCIASSGGSGGGSFTVQDNGGSPVGTGTALRFGNGTAINWTLTDLGGNTIRAVPNLGSHAAQHQNGGTDEVATATPGANAIPKADGTGKITSGWLGAHASLHQNGGADEVATATPTANAIPKADGTGKLASGWIPTPAPNWVFAGNLGSATVAASTTTYASPVAQTFATNETLRAVLMPTACTLRDLYVRTGSAQGAGGSLVATLRIIGASAADTSIVATVAAGTAGNTTVSDTSNTAAVAAGERVSIKFVNNDAGAASAGVVQISWRCN